jgi:hypothetical protein
MTRTESPTRLHRILTERGMTQTDLYNLIQAQTGKTIGRDRINRIVNGKQTNFQVDTAKIISNALGLTIDEILD